MSMKKILLHMGLATVLSGCGSDAPPPDTPPAAIRRTPVAQEYPMPTEPEIARYYSLAKSAVNDRTVWKHVGKTPTPPHVFQISTNGPPAWRWREDVFKVQVPVKSIGPGKSGPNPCVVVSFQHPSAEITRIHATHLIH
jgi:hypothetical protein